MKNDFFTSLRAFGDFKLQLTVEDFMNAMDNVARGAENALLAKVEKGPSPEFILRRDAMKMFNVTTVLTMIKWEEKGFLNPYRIGGRTCYCLHEVFASFKKFRDADC